MAVDPRYYHYQQRKIHLKDFQRKAKLMLNDRDRKYLYGVLKDYQSHRQVELLVSNLHRALDTPAKMDLLMDIRYFIPTVHLARFDQLAPYHKMANPIQLRSPEDFSPVHNYNSLGRLYSQKDKRVMNNISGTMSLGRKARSVMSSPQTPSRRLPEDPNAGNTGPVKTVLLTREPDDNLGFSVRGGSEHGLGIFVSELIEHSPADRAGIEPGDHILEVNSIKFENIASSSAVKVLTGTARLKITIQRVGKIPGFKFAREKTSWYDIDEGRLVEGSYEDHGTFHFPAGMSFVDGVIERRIHLSLTKENQFLGFNVRGGSEYGLGVYVSKVDPGGVAEQFGLKIGDQIIAVNNRSFEHISHSDAVDVLRAHKTLIMTVRDVAKYPAFKEIYAEYSWIDTLTGGVTRSRSGLINSVPVTPAMIHEGFGAADGSFMEVPEDTVVDSRAGPLPNHHGNRFHHGNNIHQDDPDEDNLDNNTVHDDSRTSAGIPSLLQDVDDLESDMEEQEQVMSFPDNARLTIPNSPTASDPSTRETALDNPDAVLEHFESMLLPHSRDVILQEKNDEGVVTGENHNGKEERIALKPFSKKKNAAPKSQIGVLALQLENMPEEMKKIHKAERERVQSLRNPGDINPRQFEDIELNVKKNRTFREMLFGTKSRAKSKHQVPLASKNKTRKPLSNLGFTQVGNTASASDSIELNVEDMPKSAKFVRGVGSQVMLHGASHQTGSADMLEEHARRLLLEDEVTAVTRHIKRYENGGSLDGFMKPLQAIIDTTEKRALFTEIRRLIRPGDVAMFDSMVNKHEGNTYEELNDHFTKSVEDLLQAQSRDSGANILNSKRGGRNPPVHNTGKSPVERDERDNREKLARLAREKRQSITDELSFSADQRRMKEIVTSSSPTAQHVLEIHRPKSNSKVYKALRNGDLRSPRSISSSSTLSSPSREVGGGMMMVAPQNHHVIRTSSPVQEYASTAILESRTPILESESQRMESKTHMKNYASHHSNGSLYGSTNDGTIQANDGTPGNDGTGQIYDTEPVYDVADEDPRSSVHEEVVLLSKTPKSEEEIVHIHSDDNLVVGIQSDSLVAALELLDELDDYNDDYPESQHSPRSVASMSTIASTRYGSYDVHSNCSEDLNSPTRNPPVFIPPPPPLDPPPPGEEEGEEGAWSEWVTEDVTQEVINNSSVGLLRISPKVETMSKGSQSPCPSLDYFSGSMNETESRTVENQRNELYENNIVESPSPASSGGTFTKKVSESLPQVNSLRDTLRSRRKSVERPKLSLDTYMSPNELFPPGWGSRSLSSKEQEGSSSSNSPQPTNQTQNSDSGYGGRLNANMSNNSPTSVSSREVAAFMTEAECKGDVLYRQRRSMENLLAVEHSDDVFVQEPTLVVLGKTRASLGISISGGCDSRSQPDVRIKQVFPGGAAADEGTLKPGMKVLSIDGESFINVSHIEAVDIIRRSYSNKKQEDMEILVLDD